MANQLTADQANAALEIRRQLSQTLALVSGAKCRLQNDEAPDEVAIELLDMAEDVIGDLEYINRLVPEPVAAAAEEAHG